MRLPRPQPIDALQGLLVLVLGAIWWPALTTQYGLGDDYSFLAYWGHPDLKVAGSDIVRMGRPLSAVFMRVAFLGYQNVEDLVWLRALSAAFMAWFGVLLFRSLQDAGWPPVRSWFSALVVLATPPFVVYAGWAITCVGPMSAFAALAGSRAYLKAFCWKTETSVKAKTAALIFAVAMILVAACLYQPTASLFLLLPLATALAPPAKDGSLRPWRGLGGAVVVLAASLALYFLLFKLSMTSLGAADWASQRGALVTDVSGKLRFLWARPIRDLLQLWTPLDLDGPSSLVWTLSLVAGGVAALGLLVGNGARWQGVVKWACLLVALGFAYLPVAAVAENTANYRTQAAPYATWLLFLVAGLAGYAPQRPWLRKTGVILLGLFAVVFAWQARKALKFGLVDPQHYEWSVLTRLLDEQVTAETTALCFRMPHRWRYGHGIRAHEEFGLPSTRTTWGAACLPLVHLRKRFSPRFADALQVMAFAPWRTVDPCGSVLIDAYGALSGDPGKPEPERTFWGHFLGDLQLAPFGRVRLFDGNWVYSKRFGFARIRNLPPLDRHTQPPTAPIPAEEGVYFFLLCEGRWFWTSEDTFPVVYDLDRGKQAYLLAEGEARRPVLTPTETLSP